MYNLLIVDDNDQIREGLTQYVDWENMGFRVIGEVESAPKAIGIIEFECVDVLLTDIVMPDMDGLQLIHEAKLINPYIKVVILSAYEKFEYAREAIRLGAYSYLTKPVKFNLLKDEFEQIHKLLEAEKEERLEKKEFSNFAQEQFLNNLANSNFKTEAIIREKAGSLQLQLFSTPFCMLRILYEEMQSKVKKDGFDEKKFLSIKAETVERIKAFFESRGSAYAFSNSFLEIAVLYFPYNAVNLREQLDDLGSYLEEKTGLALKTGVGRVYDSIMLAPDSFAQAGKALEYRFFKNNASFIFYEEISSFYKGEFYISEENREAILNYLCENNKTELKAYVGDILSNITNLGEPSAKYLYDACIEIILIVNKYISTNVDSKPDLEKDELSLIRTLLNKHEKNKIQDLMMEFIERNIELISENNERSIGIVTDNVIKYIDEHFSEEITLKKLSEVVYMNPAYLSRLFKEKTGENFIDYLTKVRIERAKAYLQDLSLRIYDVTELVGYESRRHFRKIFKDTTGLTPKEYRNKI